jgi:hypothetical protein
MLHESLLQSPRGVLGLSRFLPCTDGARLAKRRHVVEIVRRGGGMTAVNPTVCIFRPTIGSEMAECAPPEYARHAHGHGGRLRRVQPPPDSNRPRTEHRSQPRSNSRRCGDARAARLVLLPLRALAAFVACGHTAGVSPPAADEAAAADCPCVRRIRQSASGALRKETEHEFGRATAPLNRVLGSILLWSSRYEQRWHPRGRRREPRTFVERRSGAQVA